MCAPVVFTAMGASASTAATLAAVSQIGLIAGGTMMSINAQKQAMAYQQQQAALQRRQYKMQADAATLEATEKELERKRKYNSQLSTNRALLAQMNITADSASSRAFFKANKETMKRDVERIKMAGVEKRLAAMYGVQQADVMSSAAKSKYKMGVVSTVGRSLLAAKPIAQEGGFLLMALKKEDELFGYSEKIGVNRGGGFQFASQVAQSQANDIDNLVGRFADAGLKDLQQFGEDEAKKALEMYDFGSEEIKVTNEVTKEEESIYIPSKVEIPDTLPKTKTAIEAFEKGIYQEYEREIITAMEKIAVDEKKNCFN